MLAVTSTRVKLVITDLDGTLYNWVDTFVPSFLAMVDEIHRLSGVDKETLKKCFKNLHERYGTSEYSFAIEELDVLRKIEVGKSPHEILKKYWPAVEAYRETRDRNFALYPGVETTLQALREQGRIIVAQTDSIDFYAFQRLKSRQIEELFHGLCAPSDHGVPLCTPPEYARTRSPEHYKTSIPTVIPVPSGAHKPNPEILRAILRTFSVNPVEALFVGDSLSRDIVMAQECGVFDVLAQYGATYDRANYKELIKFTYWKNEDVESEASIAIKPTFVIQKFPDLLHVIDNIEGRK